MRKLLLCLLLPFVFLLSQQGAVVHEISHLAELTSGAATGPGSSGHLPGDLQCEACLAFAHLAGVATAHVVPPALLSFGFAVPANEAPSSPPMRLPPAAAVHPSSSDSAPVFRPVPRGRAARMT
jgi:hypothetical protein